LEEFNREEPEIAAAIDWEEELEDQEYEVGNDPFLMNTEEAEQFLIQAGIRFKEEVDELRFKDYGEFDELESNTVSLDSSDEKDEPEWEYRNIPGEEEEEEYNDPTPSMRAYALKYWHYPRVSDAECSSDSDLDPEKSEEKWQPQVHTIIRVNMSSLRRQCQNQKMGRLFLAGLMVVILGFVVNPVTTTTHENVIFESIGEMAGATSYLHVQVTISLSSITQQFELYKAKLQARFTDPHKGAAIMNQQFAKNLNMSVNGYLES
jgi:hypothetical protein